MAVLRQQVIPLNDYPSGSRQFGPFNVPDSSTTAYFEFARCTTATPDIWPNTATRLQIDLEGSTDGGQTWTPAGGAGAFGGIHTLRNGTESTLSTFVVPLPVATGRKIRINVAITDGPLRTEGFAELRD